MANSSVIDAAILARLVNDATLQALLPDGVWFDEAAQGKKHFVVVSLIDAVDEGVFGGRAIEDALYLIEARDQNASSITARAAAARIDALFEDQPLTATGYNWMTTHREERIVGVEVDGVDPSIRWQRHGGRYRVQFSLVGA